MIECKNCGALNTKESMICGSCGMTLEEHEGAKPIKIPEDEKPKMTLADWVTISLWIVFIVSYVVVFDVGINGIIGGVALFIARKRNDAILEVIAWVGIGLFVGTLMLALILTAWGL